MNWKIRLKNPSFWVAIITVIFTTVGAYFHIEAKDITSWGVFFSTLGQTISNPYLLVSIIVSAAGIFMDPTTKGLQDSPLVMVKTKPTATPIEQKEVDTGDKLTEVE